jgi:hypothetical protein
MNTELQHKVIANLLEQVDLAKGDTGMKASLDVLQKASDKLCIGIIGGSGFDDPDILKNRKETEMMTPFGAPSGPVITGQISGVDCVLIARHGPRVRCSPPFILDMADSSLFPFIASHHAHQRPLPRKCVRTEGFGMLAHGCMHCLRFASRRNEAW